MSLKSRYKILIIMLLIIGAFFIFKSISNSHSTSKVDNNTSLVISTTEPITIVPYTDLSTSTPITTTVPTTSSKVLGVSSTPNQPSPTNISYTSSPSNSSSKWTYFPVDKTTALPSSFVPDNLTLISSYGIPTLASGSQLRREVLSDLKDMYLASKSAGVGFRVTSPYRSYSTQQSTFNYWVSTELAKGESQQQAEASANTYSAYPGHSEHQLGTTMDIDSPQESGSNLLDPNFAPNQPIWNWLNNNMEKYGFVLSYPANKVDKTGYISEPWHIRWVGKDIALKILATDYKNPNNNNTSTSYLRGVYSSMK